MAAAASATIRLHSGTPTKVVSRIQVEKVDGGMVVSPWWGGGRGTRAGLRRVARLQACVGAGAAADGRWQWRAVD
ncbi:hypothetical protein GmRootA79_23880 [Acidovorax sp. A79]